VTGVDALKRIPSVVIGRHPLTWDAEAYFTTEETRNLALPFEESNDFPRWRRSTSGLLDVCNLGVAIELVQLTMDDIDEEDRMLILNTESESKQTCVSVCNEGTEAVFAAYYSH
jgi:hypothetical protein